MSALVTLLLASCQWLAPTLPPAPLNAEPSRLHEVGGGVVIRLSDRIGEAEIVLPATNRPEGHEELGVYELREGWRVGKGRKGEDDEGAWVIDAPVLLPDGVSRSAPDGLVLMQGEDKLSYRCPPRRLQLRWCARSGELLLASDVPPAELEPPLVLVSQTALKTLGRVDPGASDLPVVDYVTYEHTIRRDKERLTRPGLLVPAPGALTWTLTVPPDARLDLAATLVDLGLGDAARSDGVRLIVEVNGQAIASEVVRSPERFDLHRVDLSTWAGQEVTLTLRSDPLDSSDWDYLFLGEPTVSGASPSGPRRIVVIGLDTTRWASFTQSGHSPDTSSALDPMAESSVIFDWAFTPAPRTRPSFRTAITGRRPFAAIDAETIGDVFREQGFLTAGFTANVHLVPRFGFNDGFDFWQFENAMDADVQINRAKTWLRKEEDRDVLMFVHFMDPHNFYKAPLFYTNKFVTVEPDNVAFDDNRWAINAMARRLTEDDKLWLEQRYDGEVNYMADQLAGFVAWLSQLPGETLIVMHSDHGEEFFEHGGYEHNHTLYQEVVHAVLWVRPPGGWGGGPHRMDDNVALMDIAPTLYDFAGIPQEDWPPLDGVSLRPLLDAGQAELAPALREQLAARPLPIGHLMYDRERWAVISGRHKYIVQTMNGDEELYDLEADPEEQNNLAAKGDRARIDPYLSRLSEATGWPAGPGLRVKVDGVGEAFEIHFDQPVQAAMVFDPDAGAPRRPNIEWGEPSPVGPEEVGSVELSEDGLRLRFTPGSYGEGTIGVVTGAWGVDGELVFEEARHRISETSGAAKLGRARVSVMEGAVILPQDSVRQRMADDLAAQEEDSEAMEALRLLGYVGDE